MAVGAMIWKESLNFLNLNVLLNSKFSALFNSTKLGKRCQYIVAKGQTVLGHLFIKKMSTETSHFHIPIFGIMWIVVVLIFKPGKFVFKVLFKSFM